MLPDGTIVSGSRDKYVKVWKVDSDTCVQTLSGHTEVGCFVIFEYFIILNSPFHPCVLCLAIAIEL